MKLRWKVSHIFFLVSYIFQQLKSEISQIDQNGVNPFCDKTLHIMTHILGRAVFFYNVYRKSHTLYKQNWSKSNKFLFPFETFYRIGMYLIQPTRARKKIIRSWTLSMFLDKRSRYPSYWYVMITFPFLRQLRGNWAPIICSNYEKKNLADLREGLPIYHSEQYIYYTVHKQAVRKIIRLMEHVSRKCCLFSDESASHSADYSRTFAYNSRFKMDKAKRRLLN